MSPRKKTELPKPRIPLPRQAPKVERDQRKESSRRRCRVPVKREEKECEEPDVES